MKITFKHEQDKRSQIVQALKQQFALEEEIVIVCVGTDRSAGDSLGPIVGTLLSEKLPWVSIYGNLEYPVHAQNLEQTLNLISDKHPKAFVLAVDACLGSMNSVGCVTYSSEPLKPGLAVKKNLPEVGHAHLTGIVNIGGFLEFFALQNARLHTTFTLAQRITEVITDSLQGSKRRIITKTIA